MTDFPNRLRLKELAEEDIYFAKRDRELIKALHRRKLAKLLEIEAKKERKKAKTLEEEYAKGTQEHQDKPKRLGRFYRKLIKKVLKLVSKKRR